MVGRYGIATKYNSTQQNIKQAHSTPGISQLNRIDKQTDIPSKSIILKIVIIAPLALPL